MSSHPAAIFRRFAAHPSAPALALAGLFIAGNLPSLGVLEPNFDEGVYILQSRLVRAGQIPSLDFYYHQTPLYLYLLAAVSLLGDSLTACRTLSLLATAGSGVVVEAMGRRLLPQRYAALVAQAIFYLVPLQHFGKLALPNATMLLLSTTGIYALVFFDERRWTLAGAVSLALAVLIKPLAAPTVLAAVSATALLPDQRRKLPALVGGGLTVALGSWGLLHAITGGRFTDLLVLQAGRYSQDVGFHGMASFPDFHAAMVERGVTTAIGWNLSEHLSQLTTAPGAAAHVLLVLTVAAALFISLGRGALRLRARLTVLALWLAFPFSFSVFVWEPSWDHYFIQYLPPMVLLCGFPVCAAWKRGWSGRVALGIGGALFVAASLSGVRIDRPWYQAVHSVARRAERPEVFSFSPLVHVVGGTRPACGLIDPMNVYGPISMVVLWPDSPLSRFHLSTSAVIDCVGSDVPVIIDSKAFLFLDAPLILKLAATRERLLFLGTTDRDRFNRLVVDVKRTGEGPRAPLRPLR